jgi:arylsulfatase
MESVLMRNVLLITADMASAHHFGCYGSPVAASPNLDRLAARGVRFDNAYCATTPCIPARASLMSGLYAHTHGKTAHMKMLLNPHPPLLPELLSRAGYQTGIVGKTHWYPPTDRLGSDEVHLTIDNHLTPELGMDDAYIRYLDGRGLIDYADTPWEVVQAQLAPDALPEDALKVNWTGRTAADLLKRFATDDKPFFLMCSFVEPHGMGSVQRALLDQFMDKPVPPINPGDPAATPIKQQAIARWDTSNDNKHTYRAGVYASLSLVDQNIGRLLDQLDAYDLWDTTTVIFTTDHGDLMYDHGCIEKTFLYEEAIHVPLIITGAGVPTGETRNPLISHIDIMPTVLDLAEATPPDLSVEGRTLVPLLDDPETEWRNTLFCEVEQSVHLRDLVSSSISKMVRQGDWKYIYTLLDGNTAFDELYNMADDPHETRNIAADHPERVAQMRSELLNWLVRTELNRLHPVPENHYPVPTLELAFV